MMASDITVNVAINGEAKFTSALKNIATQTKELDSELKLNAETMETADDKQAKLAERSEILAKKFELQKQQLQLLTDKLAEEEAALSNCDAELQKAVSIYGENSAEAQKAANAYNRQAQEVSNLQTKINKTNTDMARTTNEQQKLGASSDNLKSIFGELGNVIQQKTGVNVTALGEKFTALTGVSTTMAAGVAGAVAAFVELVKVTSEAIDAAAEYADEMQTMSKVTGVSVDTLQELSYMEELVDVSMSTISGSMKKLTKSMGEAQSGTASYKEAFRELGVSIYDTEGNLRSSEDVFWDIIEALRGIDNVAERDNAAMQLLGKSAQDLNPLIEMTAEDFEALRQEAHDTGYVLSDEMVESLSKCDDAQQRLAKATEAFSNNWGGYWAPMKTAFVDFATIVVNKCTELTPVLADLLTNLVIPPGFNNIFNLAKQAIDFGNATEESASGVDTLTESVEESATTTTDATDRWKAYGDKMKELYPDTIAAADAIKEAREAVKGAGEEASTATGSGAELTATYEKLSQVMLDNKDACDSQTYAFAEQQMEMLKLKATVQTLSDELPSLGQNVEWIGSVLVQSGTDAATWAGWYNDAFDSITSGFDTLQVNTENTLSKWVETMNKNAAITEAWTWNTRAVVDAANQMAQEGDTALREAVQIMMDGGVEQYGTAMQELSDAIARGDQEAVAEITAAITNAGEVSLHEAANQFMLAENLTEAQLKEMIANGKVIMEDGKYVFADGGEDLGEQVAEGIEDSSATSEAATKSVVSAAAEAFVGGEAEMAWNNGGKALGQYAATGIKSKQSVVQSAARTVAQAAGQACRQAYSSFYSAGKYLDEGLAAGIRAGKSGVVNAAVDVAQSAADASKQTLDINSPSKVAMAQGKSWDEGMTKGIMSAQSEVEAASRMVAKSAVIGSSASVINDNSSYSPVFDVVVNAAAGQNVNAIANAVMDKINSTLIRYKGARA